MTTTISPLFTMCAVNCYNLVVSTCIILAYCSVCCYKYLLHKGMCKQFNNTICEKRENVVVIFLVRTSLLVAAVFKGVFESATFKCCPLNSRPLNRCTALLASSVSANSAKANLTK